MLSPKRVKYRRMQKGRMRGKAWRGSSLSFGDYGLKTLDAAWITDRQIEAGRIAIARFVRFKVGEVSGGAAGPETAPVPVLA